MSIPAIRGTCYPLLHSSLPLLVAGILADYHHATMSLDNLALDTYLFYAGANFHLSFSPFMPTSDAILFFHGSDRTGSAPP